MTKPFQAEEVLARVENVLGRACPRPALADTLEGMIREMQLEELLAAVQRSTPPA